MSSENYLAQDLMPVELWDPVVQEVLRDFEWPIINFATSLYESRIRRRRELSGELCLCCRTFYSVAADSRFKESNLKVQNSGPMIRYFESHPLSASSLAAIAIPLDVSSTICNGFSRLNLSGLVQLTHYAAAQGDVAETTQFWTSIFDSCPSLRKVGCSISAALAWPGNRKRVNLSEIVMGFSDGEEDADSDKLGATILDFVQCQEKQDIRKEKQYLDLRIHLGDENLTASRFTFVKTLVVTLAKVLDFEIVLLIPAADNTLLTEVGSFHASCSFVSLIFQEKRYNGDKFQRIWNNLRMYRGADESDLEYNNHDLEYNNFHYYTDSNDSGWHGYGSYYYH